MKEFKFVRGVYTNKSLFDNTTKNNSLFILDTKGVEVGLNAIDNESTQTQLVGASDANRDCKLYTITPEQITMKGNLVQGVTGNSYKFTPEVKAICVSDPTEKIPLNVKTMAENLIMDCLSFNYSLNKENIGINQDKDPINVNFNYNEKSFIKPMRFKVTGEVKKYDLETLDGVLLKNEIVYIFNNDDYEIGEALEGSYFNNGIKYTKCSSENYTSVLKELVIDIESLNKDKKTQITSVAETYFAPGGYYFKTTEESDDVKLTELSLNETSNDYYVYNRDGVKLGEIRLPYKENVHLFKDSVNDNMYIITTKGLVKLKDNYPNETQNLQVYNITGEVSLYEVKNDSVYKKHSDDVYKKLCNYSTETVSDTYVSLTDTTTLSPVNKSDYIIELDPEMVNIIASEV